MSDVFQSTLDEAELAACESYWEYYCAAENVGHAVKAGLESGIMPADLPGEMERALKLARVHELDAKIFEAAETWVALKDNENTLFSQWANAATRQSDAKWEPYSAERIDETNKAENAAYTAYQEAKEQATVALRELYSLRAEKGN